MMNSRSTFVTKKLSANDIGKTGSHQAGIHIPKEEILLSFFPYLDPEDYNPSVEIHVICEELEEMYLLRFVYYNGKTRDEYRLTRMTQLLRELGAVEGDTLKMRWLENSEMLLEVERKNENLETLLEAEYTEPYRENQERKIVEMKNGWTLEEI